MKFAIVKTEPSCVLIRDISQSAHMDQLVLPFQLLGGPYYLIPNLVDIFFPDPLFRTYHGQRIAGDPIASPDRRARQRPLLRPALKR